MAIYFVLDEERPSDSDWESLDEGLRRLGFERSDEDGFDYHRGSHQVTYSEYGDQFQVSYNPLPAEHVNVVLDAMPVVKWYITPITVSVKGVGLIDELKENFSRLRDVEYDRRMFMNH